jgi:uncharacterized protein (TIGR03435 family)
MLRAGRRLIFAVFAAYTTCVASGQTQEAAPQFEVISVKPASTGPTVFPSCRGNRFVERHLPLLSLVTWAFQLSALRVQGLPDWANDRNPGYSIEANALASMTDAQCRAMVQSLLASRFGMVTHREQREMRAYALTVAKKGPKMREVAPGSKDFAIMNGEVTFPSATSPDHAGVSMATFATALSGLRAVGLPVIDRTGLPGIYAFELNFSIREDDGLPTIWTALEDQLGLKLESIKAPIEVLVVDHIERPTSN